MKTGKFIAVIFVIVILSFGWKIYSYFNPNFEKCFVENNEKFQLNIEEFNSIVFDIKKLNIKVDYDISINKLPENLKYKLEKLGIDSFNLIKNSDSNCSENLIIELNVSEDWNVETLNNVKLIYSPCNKVTNLNYHYFDGNHIDIWGQGEKWLIFSDTDFI